MTFSIRIGIVFRVRSFSKVNLPPQPFVVGNEKRNPENANMKPPLGRLFKQSFKCYYNFWLCGRRRKEDEKMKKLLLLSAMVFVFGLAFVAPSFALDGYVFFGVRGTGDVRIRVMVTDLTTFKTKVYQSFQNGLHTIAEPGPHVYHFTLDATGAFTDEIEYSGYPGTAGRFSIGIASAYVENSEGWPWFTSPTSPTGWKKLTVSFRRADGTIYSISTRYWVTQTP